MEFGGECKEDDKPDFQSIRFRHEKGRMQGIEMKRKGENLNIPHDPKHHCFGTYSIDTPRSNRFNKARLE